LVSRNVLEPTEDSAPPKRDVRARLAKGTIWIAAARLSTNLLGLTTTLVLARILVPADFGLVAFGTTILSVVSAITNMSLTSALIAHKAPTPGHFHTAWTLNAARGLLIALFLCAAAKPASLIAHEPRLFALMCALSLGPILDGFQNPRVVMLVRDLIFRQQFALQVGAKVIAIVVSISCALVFKTYWALVLGTLAGQATGVLISYSLFPFRPRLSIEHYRELFSFSMWLTLGDLVLTLNLKFDSLLIGQFLGRAPLGVYSVGDNLAVLPTKEAMTPVMSTLFPALSQLVGDRARLGAAYQRAQTLVAAAALPAGIGLGLIADPLVRLTMGDKWLGAIPVVQILSLVYSIMTLAMLAQSIAMAAGETRLLFKRDVQGFLISAPVVAAGMYFGGLMGILYVRIFLAGVGILLNMQVVKHVSGVSLFRQLTANARALVSVAVMGLTVLATTRSAAPSHEISALVASIAIRVLVGVLTYVASTALFWILQGRPEGPEDEVLRFARKLWLARHRPA
jgi:O-antigen/teichoic acid export membrane protein